MRKRRRGDRAHRRAARGRAPDRARDQEPARADPRRGRDAAPPPHARRPGVRRVLRRGDERRCSSEVHRIANIVTEFTRFNRMPPPNPEPIDLVQVARGVVTLHASRARRAATAPAAARRARGRADPEGVGRPRSDRSGAHEPRPERPRRGVGGAPGPARRSSRSVPRRTSACASSSATTDQACPRRCCRASSSRTRRPRRRAPASGSRSCSASSSSTAARSPIATATKGGAVFEITLPVAGPPLLERPPNVEITGRTVQ